MSTKPIHLLFSLLLAATAAASGEPAPAPRQRASAAPAGELPLATGQVLEVDRREGRVLLNHGPVQSLGMDAMAMEFAVPDARLMALLKPGDKVRFAATWKDGDYVLTRVEVIKPGAKKHPKGGAHK